jgi:phospholipid/cholesterol/gamma-HCH transport system permease protein
MSMQASASKAARNEIRFDYRPDSTLMIELTGSWRLGNELPAPREIERQLESDGRPRCVAFDATNLRTWDTSLVAFVARVVASCAERGIEIDRNGLPEGLKHLLKLAENEPAHAVSESGSGDRRVVYRVGKAAIEFAQSSLGLFNFTGLVVIAFARLLSGRARMRLSDLIVQVQGCSAQALGILSLISFLVGTILAFMGAVQLQQFGAAIYVADLVGIGIARDMGAMMTAIIMAGRTGAAYAAELGSMKVSDEVDALATMGISPVEFLVLPRVLALVMMMPLLCLYADFIGMLGGAAVAAGVLHISFVSYFTRTAAAVTLTTLVGGLFKATVYGVLVAIAGCWRGFEAQAGSSAVGEVTTAAVVDAIIWVVTACGLFAVVFNLLHL